MITRTLRGSTWVVRIGASAILLTLAHNFFSSAVQAQRTENTSATSILVVANTESASAKLESEELPPANVAKPASTEMVLPVDLSPAVAEIAKLVQSHVSDDVILSYIRNSGVIYKPTADEIVYLNDLGVSKQVLTELIERGKTTWVGNPASEANAAPMPAVTLANAPSPSYSVAAEQPAPPPAPTAPTTVVAAPTPPVQPVTVEYFQENLSPYGTWVWIGDYGWCWRPTVVVANPEWRPYCDRGRWIYTDCGWYWESDYSWGWATFHYGRWSQHGVYGWVWTPDTVWGPSWVSWRHHDTYCGWAPLPPRARFEVGIGLMFNGKHVRTDFDFGLSKTIYTFVPYGHFQDRNPEHFRVPPREIDTIFLHSRPVNNYTVINKTRVINEGIGRQRVMAVTHQPIQPMSIRHVAATGGERKMERLDGASRTLSVYHPPHVTTTATRSSPAAPKTSFTVNRAPQRTMVGVPEAGRTTTVSGSPGRTVVPHNTGPESRPGFVPVHRPTDVKDAHPKLETPSARVPGSDHSVTRVNPSQPATVPHPTSTEPARPVNPQSAHSTTVQPARSATPLVPSRATTVQPAHPVAPLDATHSGVATPAHPETPTPAVRPATQEKPKPVQENPKPVFAPRNDSPSRSSSADNSGATRARSKAQPSPSTSPDASSSSESTSPSSPKTGSSVRYGNGNRHGD